MTRVIRSTATQRFLRNDGGWTRNLHKAQRFLDISEALATKRKFNLQGVELFYVFDQRDPSRWDIGIPLN